MANIEEDFKRQVNVKKVVKAVKNIGLFALYSKSKDCTLVITHNFILNLSEEQAWEIQCALLVKELGKWYTVHKDGPIEGNPVKQSEVDAYFYTVKSELLNIIPFTELYLNNAMLYAVDAGYVGIKADYIDMLGGLAVVKKASQANMVVISDYHVVTINKEAKSEYLAPLLF